MNWAQFNDPISHTGTVVACWSLTQEVAGSSPFNIINFFVTEFAAFSEKHLGKTPMNVLVLPTVGLSFRSNTSLYQRHSASRALDVRKTRRITTEPQQCYLQFLLLVITRMHTVLYIESVQMCRE